MSVDITLNEVNINTGNTTVRTVQHDSMPKITVNSLQPTREDGEKLINVKLRSKIITIEGTVKGSTRANFETTLDTLKRDLNVDRKNLDIEYAGATRRYNVSLRSFTMSRNFFNVTYATYSATFLVETGYGTGVDVTQSATGDALDDSLTTMAVTFDGTHIPYPTARFTIDTVGNLETIQYKSVSTGKQIEVTTAWSDGDVLLIDSEDSTFLRNGSFVDFSGEFPQFRAGSDTIQLELLGSTSIDQQQESATGSSAFGSNARHAQGFQVSATTNYSSIDIFIRKADTGSFNNVTLEIQTDSAGDPSETIVINATKTLNESNFTNENSWVKFKFDTDVSLTSGTNYWIVLSSPLSSSNSYLWGSDNSNPYPNGIAKTFITFWSSNSSRDMTFRIFNSDAFSGSIDFKQTYIKKYL